MPVGRKLPTKPVSEVCFILFVFVCFCVVVVFTITFYFVLFAVIFYYSVMEMC